jgi:hypothetical protein
MTAQNAQKLRWTLSAAPAYRKMRKLKSFS